MILIFNFPYNGPKWATYKIGQMAGNSSEIFVKFPERGVDDSAFYLLSLTTSSERSKTNGRVS